LKHTSAITASSSRTSASVDVKGKRSARHSWSRRSTKWSADDSSRSSRCSGRYGGPIFCCRPGRGSSTRIWTTYSAVGIRNSGRNHKRRSKTARRLDPRLFDALLLSQISQLPQRDGQHRKIEVADGLKIGEHLLAASQCALVLRFPLLDERVGHFHLGAEYHN
jgi:hypothetical protein